MQTICVYCASSTQVKPSYFEATTRLGRILAGAKLSVVYGGGSLGLMGQLADSTLEAGGKITGIIPRFMCEVEWNHTGLSELILVETMHERKEKMATMADAVVALPGGCGTLEELLEIITWKRLGIFTKPIVIVNLEGYFDALISMLNRAVDEHFMREEHRQMWKIVETPEEVLGAIQNSVNWNPDARSFAAL
ncbi:MAG: TIGR00730 family Rossman fold protein [Bacteroidota bacterium]|nr:TIGR00730 family Rossman fold protein [Bacteroidota bacterium]